MKYQIASTAVFDKWFKSLKDRTTRNKVLARLSRVENGNFGDFKSLGDNLFELPFSLVVVYAFTIPFVTISLYFFCTVVTNQTKAGILKKPGK